VCPVEPGVSDYLGQEPLGLADKAVNQVHRGDVVAGPGTAPPGELGERLVDQVVAVMRPAQQLPARRRA
jgi:hypothetical protein